MLYRCLTDVLCGDKLGAQAAARGVEMLLSGIILGTIGVFIWVYDFMTRLSSENSRATGGITPMRRAKRKENQ